MVFDIVSPLSVRVFAALAIASFLLFTTYTASSEPVLRAVLDVHDVRAPLASIASIHWTFLSDTYTDAALSAISALGAAVIKLGHDTLNVVPSPLLQLANLLAASAKLYVPPTMAQLYALGSGIVTGSRRIASDYPGTRLVDYFRIFAGFRADTMSATFSVSHLWGTLGLSLFCFILYSLWIFFSFEAPLDDNDLRLITTLNTQVTHTIRKIESLSKQLSNRTSNAFATLSALIVLWPAQLLRALCYQPSCSYRATYFQDTLEELHYSRTSFLDLYRRPARLILCFITRFISLAIVTLIVVLVIAYAVSLLYTVWIVYFTHKTSVTPEVLYTPADASSNGVESSSLASPLDISACLASAPAIDGHALCSRFPEGYFIHPDFHAKYELVGELGAGGNGFVLQAQRRTDRQQVAVKFSRKPNRASRHWSEHPTYGLVNSDVLVMDETHHENIITLLDVFSDDMYLYIVQELYGTLSHPNAEDQNQRLRDKWPNGSRCLESYIRINGPMSLEDAKYVFYQLVDAVAHLHSLGISHCDIKPENILVDATTFKIKLIDFGNILRIPEGCVYGMGRSFDADRRFFRGTRTFTPPEVHNGETYEANAADVWAMGLVFCFMLLGHLPFISHDVEDVKTGHIGCHYECLEFLQPVWFIIGSCLKMELLLRPTAVELQLRDDYLPLAVKRDKLVDMDKAELWAMMGYIQLPKINID